MIRWLAVLMLVSALPGAARADEAADRANAARLVDEGRQLGRAGRLVEAISKFKAAHRLWPSATNDCNVGLAYERLKDLARAHLYLSRCQRDWRETSSRPPWLEGEIAKVAAELESSAFARVSIESRPNGGRLRISSLGADDLVVAPVSLWMPFGVHTIEAEADGGAHASERLEIRSKDPVNIVIVVEGDGEPSGAEVAAKTESEPSGVEPAETQAPSPPTRSGRRTAGWVVGGAGAALMVTGAVFHALAFSTYGDLDGAPGGMAWEEDYNTYKSQRLTAYVCYGVGAAALGTGLFLLLSGDDQPSTLLGASFQEGGMSASVTWRLP